MGSHSRNTDGAPGWLGTAVSVVGTGILGAIISDTDPAKLLLCALIGAIAYGAGRFAGWQSALAVLAAAAIIPVGIPPATWLSLASLVTVLFYGLEKHLGKASIDFMTQMKLANDPDLSPPHNTRAREIASSTFKGLKEAGIGVAIALSTLVLVNYIVSKIDPNQQDLRPFEAGLIYAQIAIGGIASFRVVSVTLILAIVITAVQPRWRAVTHYLSVLKWIKRGALPLTIVSTFTLFTSTAAREYKGVWALAHRQEIIRSLEGVKLWRQATLAAVRAEARLRDMPDLDRKMFSRSFYIHGSVHPSQEEFQDLGAAIGAEAGALRASMVQAESLQGVDKEHTDASVKKIALWADAPWNTDPPGKQDVQSCKQQADRAETIFLEAREALIQIIKVQLKFPIGDEYVKPFVDAMTGTMVKNTLQSMIPENIRDLKAAREWWNRYSSGFTLEPDRNWHWNAVGTDGFRATTGEMLSTDAILTERTSAGVLSVTERYTRFAEPEPVSPVWGGSERPGERDNPKTFGEPERPPTRPGRAPVARPFEGIP